MISVAEPAPYVLETLPFEEKRFDVALASYVAHGLKAEERKLIYAEMSRVAKRFVVIYDYNDKRSLLTTFIEWLEGGDYFHFIHNAEPEMIDFISEIKKLLLGCESSRCRYKGRLVYL